jgi:hypothetical protein
MLDYASDPKNDIGIKKITLLRERLAEVSDDPEVILIEQFEPARKRLASDEDNRNRLTLGSDDWEEA